MNITRRGSLPEFFRRRARTSIAAILTVTALGPSALAVTAAASAQPSPIRHVVVIYLENHSFDSVLGFWCDDDPGRCPDGGMPTTVTLSNGAQVQPYADPDTVPNVLHTVSSQLAAMNIHDGVPRMNGWQNIPDGSCDATHHYRCISGYEPDQIPNLTSLAQHFAISDHTFSLADSPSWGGHLYAAMSSLDGFLGNNPQLSTTGHRGTGWGCNSDRVAQWLSPQGAVKWVPSCIPDFSLGLPHGGAFRATPVKYAATIFDRLTSAGLSWKMYGATRPGEPGSIWGICFTLAECLYTSQSSHVVEDSQFMTDARTGALSAFSEVTPGGQDYRNACHNMMSMTACDNWVGQLVSAVESGPDWSSTAIFITFDDCGGFYDQVPPPLAPDGTQEGPRVPMIIVSPYARPGYTDTTESSFAGILAYTEHNFGLTPLGVNDANAYGFKNAFNYSQAPLKPVRMVTRPLPPSAKRIRLTPALLNDPT